MPRVAHAEANESFDPDTCLTAMDALAMGLNEANQSNSPADPALLAEALRNAQQLIQYAQDWLRLQLRGPSNLKETQENECNHG